MASTIQPDDRQPILDFPGVLKRVNGNRDLAVRLLHSFCKILAPAPGQLADALAAGDLLQAHHIAHQMSGSAANLGLRALATEARRLEDVLSAVRAGAAVPAADAVAGLAALFAEAVATIQASLPLPQPAMATGAEDLAGAFRSIDSQLGAQDCEALERLPTLLAHLPEGERSAFAEAVQALDFARGRTILREVAARMEIPLD
jgi:HPt (histidine-containing phosphotransfer) domain-containing protein